MRIHQVLVGARAGDAITQIALSLREVLASFGESLVFARLVDPTAADAVRPLSEFSATAADDDIVIFHVSIGDEAVWNTVEGSPCRVWLYYHNITPPEFSIGRQQFAELLAQGRDGLAGLSKRAERVMTFTDYNVEDLASLGVHEVSRVPAVVNPFRLNSAEPAPAFRSQIESRVPGELVLFVGQVLPHKRPDRLVAAHHLLTAHRRPNATLVLAGFLSSTSYARRLEAYVRSLGLSERVWVTGGIDNSELAELYRRADVFVTASAHEGYCLPVVEAMAMSVPVVTVPCGALADTADGAALLVPDASPTALCEAVDLALEPSVRTEMVLAGRRAVRRKSLPSALAETERLFREWALERA
jgi:glycosyltransferase involved in cell wall biosynthesis